MFKNFVSFLFKKKEGFTLVEMLVVISIILIMTSVVFANYRPGGQSLALQRSAQKLAQDIRRAQEMAMSATICEPCGNEVPPRYGVYIAAPSDNPTSYKLFADNDNNSDGTWDPADDEQIGADIEFEPGVYLSDLSATGTGCDLSTLPTGHRRTHLTFAPPDPETKLLVGHPPASDPLECSEIILTLRVGTSGPDTAVKVNKAGLIYVE